jgi:eukaryotic-like serine/threonine-protein kinase
VTDEKWRKTWDLYREWRSLSPEAFEVVMARGSLEPDVASELRALLEATRSLNPDSQIPQDDSDEPPYKAGFDFGRYLILGLLGRGGSGQIYLARDKELGRTIALKCLPGGSSHDTETLLREARAASALNHPNIVTVYEVIRFDDRVAIAMEFVDGQSLRRSCGSPLPSDIVVRYASQVAAALAVTHAMGIVHADIKPENIIVRPDGYLKVLDFGLARRLDDQVEARIAGTLRYIPPEVLQGEPSSERGDIFSFGLVLYEIAVGAHAFPGATQFDTADAIAEQEAVPPRRLVPSISRELDQLIVQMLDKNPAKRPSAAKIAEELRPLASPDPAIRKGRLWRWGIAAAVLPLALLSVRIWHQRDQNASLKPLLWADFTAAAADSLTAGCLSPDGSQYVFADREGVIRQLFIPPTSAMSRRDLLDIGQLPNQRIDQMQWLGPQAQVLVSSRDLHADNATGILSVVDLASREIRQLSITGRKAVPSPDGSRVAYTSIDGRFLEVAAMAPLRILCRIRVDDPAGVKGIIWSPYGSLLHYWTIPGGRLPLDLWKSSVLHTVEPHTGRLLLEQKLPAVSCAVMLHDGRLLYEGNESSNITEVSTEPTTGRLTGNFRLLGKLEGLETNLSASADGRTIVGIALRRAVTALHVGDLDASTHRLKNVRSLSDASTEAFPHAWTPDNQAIIYESSRFGTQDLFEQRLNGKRAERIVAMPDQQVMPNISPDGQFVVFLSGPVAPSSEGVTQWKLMRMPLAGGPVVEVPTNGPVQEFNCQYRAARCVLREFHGGEMIFSVLDPLRGKTSELMRVPTGRPALGDWALSPDGRKVTLLDTSRYPTAIRILDLDHAKEDRVDLKGPTPVGGVASWSADGKGWFLAQESDRMMFYDAHGSPHFVGETGHWLLPSWDDKKVAFTERDSEADGYIAHR